MSKEAQAWVSTLPLAATKTLIGFRVLDKLADAHHTDTDHAYRNVDRLADELSCSTRHVQRALRELERLQLLIIGDQSVLPRSVRANHAPTAYRLPWRQEWKQPALPDPAAAPAVTSDVTPPEPVDNSARGDRHAALGVTNAVAHRTQERREVIPSATTDRARACASAAAVDGQHLRSPKLGVCVWCGERIAA